MRAGGPRGTGRSGRGSSVEQSPVIEIESGTIVTPSESIRNGYLRIAGETIEAVETNRRTGGTSTIDAEDRVILPGLVDLHGDDLERHLVPRSGARIDPQLAIESAARSNLMAGITTKFHAIAFEETHENDRTLEQARQLTEGIRSGVSVPGDNRIHARCELACESKTAIEDLLTDRAIDFISLLHHSPDERDAGSESAFARRYTEYGHVPAHALDRLADSRRSVPEHIRQDRAASLIRLATAVGTPVAHHDARDASAVDRAADRGVSVSEFPLSLEAVRRAKQRDLWTVMGAPNLVTGGSHTNNVAVSEAIDANLVDILCSDYHPATLLASVFVETGEPLHVRAGRVSKRPADLVGLHRRGRIEPGARADLLVVDPDPVPTIERIFIAGQEILRTTEAGDSAGEVEIHRPSAQSLAKSGSD